MLRANPPPLLRYASCAAELTPASEVEFKLISRKCLVVCTAERSKGGGFGLPKPEDMSGAVHTTKHLHRQPSRITTPKANEKKRTELQVPKPRKQKKSQAPTSPRAGERLLSATLKLNHLSPFTQRQQTRLRINPQLGARVSDVQIAHSQLPNSI